MNRTSQPHAGEIEARLHRSLTNQVNVPKLDHRFDAAVWANIGVLEQTAKRVSQTPVTRRAGAARWLFVSNVAGVLVTVLLVLYFGFRMLSGMSVNVDVADLSPAQTAAIAQYLGWGSAAAVFIVGVMLTPYGHRLRSELRAEFS